MDLTVDIVDETGAPIIADIDLDGTVTAGVSTVTQAITDFKELIPLTVALATYRTYSTSFRVFDEDITIEIKIVPDITDTLDPNYRRPYPYFFTVPDPCSYDVYVYNASSSAYGQIYYYLDNVEFSVSSKDIIMRFCTFGDFQIKQRMLVFEDPTNCGTSSVPLWDKFYATIEVGDISNTLQQNLDLDTTTNITLVDIVPVINLDLDGPGNLLQNTFYYQYQEFVTVTPEWQITNPKCLDPNAPVPTLLWKVTDPDGVEISDVQPGLGPFGLGSLVQPADVAITFTLSKIGDYCVEALLTDCCGTVSTTTIIPVSNFLVLNPTDANCLSYTLSNNSKTIDVVYTVSDIDGNTLVPLTDLPKDSTAEIPTTHDGIYTINTAYTDKFGEDRTQAFIITRYCDLESCFASFIQEIFCTTLDCECTDALAFEATVNRMIALGQTFFMELNSEYVFNQIYDILGESKLQELLERDAILKKLQDFCSGRGCTPCKCTSSNGNKTTSGCGCK